MAQFTFERQRAEVSFGGHESGQRPLARLRRIGPGCEQGRCFSRQKSHIEAPERKSQASADRLDERLFARPAIEESLVFLRNRHLQKLRSLAR